MPLQSSVQDYYDDLAYASRTTCLRTYSMSSLFCLQLPNIWPFSRVEYDDVDQSTSYGQSTGGYQQYQPTSSIHGSPLPTAQPIFSSHLASTAFAGSSINDRLNGRGDYSGASSGLPLTNAYSMKKRVDEDIYADRLMRQDSRLEDDEFVSTVERKHKSTNKSSRKESKKDRQSTSGRTHRSSSSKSKKSRSNTKSQSSLSPTKLSSSPSASPAILHRDEDASSGESSEDELIVDEPRKPATSPPQRKPSASEQSRSSPALPEPSVDKHERALPSVSPVPGETSRKS